MALFKKKKVLTEPPTSHERVLEFNTAKIGKEMENLSTRLGALTDNLGVLMVEEVVNMTYNIAVVELGRARTHDEFLVFKGRVRAFRDLADYIARSKAAKPKEAKKEASRDAIRTRRADSQAGLAN